MDAPPLLRPPRWAVALAVAIAWVGSTAIARADPLVNNLVSSSAPAAHVLSRGVPVLVSHPEVSYSALQPADEPAPETLEDDSDHNAPLGSVLLTMFIPSFFANSTSPPGKVSTDITPSTDTKVIDDSQTTDTTNNTDTTNKTDCSNKTDNHIHHAPEPATLLSALIGLGFTGFAGLRRRRQVA
jgi:hypothetical protein